MVANQRILVHIPRSRFLSIMFFLLSLLFSTVKSPVKGVLLTEGVPNFDFTYECGGLLSSNRHGFHLCSVHGYFCLA